MIFLKILSISEFIFIRINLVTQISLMSYNSVYINIFLIPYIPTLLSYKFIYVKIFLIRYILTHYLFQM